MPQPFNNAVITNRGASLLAMAQSGKDKIQFTRMAIGNGVYSEEEKVLGVLQAATGLKAEKNSYPFSSTAIVSGKSVKLTALITNHELATSKVLIEEGYYINEIGIFARPDADGGDEVLYSIAVTSGNNGDFMPPYNGYSPAQIVQDYYVTVDNSAEVAIQAGTGAVALAEDLEELENRVAAESSGNSSRFKEIWDFLGEMCGTATPEDIDRIIGGAYTDAEDTGGIFEAATTGDIDDIIDGNYVEGQEGDGLEQTVNIGEIVENAFKEV